MKNKIHFIYLLFIAFLFQACSTQKMARIALKKIKPSYSFNEDSIPKAPDYSNVDDWFLYQSDDSNTVDVFFVHPTTYLNASNWNQPQKDTINIAKTQRKSIRPQALLFDSIANVYAPKYRQATFYSFFDLDNNGSKALDLAFTDIKNAFLYYIENENKNKAIIVAGHSQGSYQLLRLLKEKEIQDRIGDRLVIAYIIGWPVRESDLAEVPYAFCQDSLQLSCITSWNSQKKHATITMKSYAEGEKVYTNNPLSWRSDEVYYDKSYNKGAYLLVEDSLVFRPNYIGAQNYEGILAIDKPKDKGKLYIRKFSANYHVYDIAFFYRNLQENALLRKREFLEEK